jgi:hypothetical protein
MKRIFAVALLLLSFASVAVADGSGQHPPGGRRAPNRFQANASV